MKKNSIWMMTAAMGMAVAFCGTAFAQGNGNNQPTGQAGTTSNVVVTNTSAQPVPVTVTNQTTPPTSFTVNNTAAQAVPTKDRNNAAYQPFSYDMTYNFQTGEEFEIKQTSEIGRAHV